MYRTVTSFGRPFQTVTLQMFSLMVALQPRSCLNKTGLGSFRFARHYSGNHYCFLFLRVLRCFSSPGLPPVCTGYPASRMGCPIRTSTDQWLFAPPRSFSQLITSFFASGSQGIPRTLLVTFFSNPRFLFISYFSLVIDSFIPACQRTLSTASVTALSDSSIRFAPSVPGESNPNLTACQALLTSSYLFPLRTLAYPFFTGHTPRFFFYPCLQIPFSLGSWILVPFSLGSWSLFYLAPGSWSLFYLALGSWSLFPLAPGPFFTWLLDLGLFFPWLLVPFLLGS